MTSLDITKFNIKFDNEDVVITHNDYVYLAIKYAFNNSIDLQYLFTYQLKFESPKFHNVLFDTYSCVFVPKYLTDDFDRLLHNDLMIMVHDWSKIQKILKGLNES